MKSTFLITASLAALVVAGCGHVSAAAPSEGAVYTNLTLIDPAARTLEPDSWVLVEDGRIAETGAGPAPAAETARDMDGLYVMPGFIDVHGHLTAGPHAMEMIDGQPTITIESVDEITQFHARMALAFGVTTVRNPAAPPTASAAYDRRLEAGEWIGPDTLHAGAAIQPPPFGGSAFAYPQTPEEYDAEAARQAELGMTYFKLYHGLTAEELAMGVQAAVNHGLEPIAHLDQVSWTEAARIGVKGLLHALPTSPDLLEPEARAEFLTNRARDGRTTYQWFEAVDLDGPLMNELYVTLLATGATVDLTLQVNALTVSEDAVDVLYPREIEPYVHPRTLQSLRQFLSAAFMVWTDEDVRRSREAMETVFAFARRIHNEGVPVGIGTDGPGGGPFYLVELDLMEQAGFSTWEILDLATRGGAEVMRLEDETGRIAPGLEADLVFLGSNPAEDLSNAGDVRWVMSNGQLHDAAAMREAARNG